MSKTLRAEIADLHDQLRALLAHPETTQQDKASIVQAGLCLSEIERRHMGRWTPVNPATLPPRRPGQSYPPLPKGWALDWENSQEVGHG
jgi:hypothetical protein